MRSKPVLSRYAVILIAIAAVGVFAAGFGYGYEAPFLDAVLNGHRFGFGPHAPFPSNF